MKKLILLIGLFFVLTSAHSQIFYTKELRSDTIIGNLRDSLYINSDILLQTGENIIPSATGLVDGINISDSIDQSVTTTSSPTFDTAKANHFGGQTDFTIGKPGKNVTIGTDTITLNGEVRFASYTRHHDIIAGAATLGPTAPTPTTVGTYRGLAFDADNEVVHFVPEVPADWDAISDMTLVVHWYSQDGDIIQNGETVKWDATYRVTAAGDSVDNGTVVVATTTLTGGASEIDKQHYETSITIDYDNADQPLVIGSDIGFQFDRDVGTDTYTGDGIVYKWDLVYTANKLATH